MLQIHVEKLIDFGLRNRALSDSFSRFLALLEVERLGIGAIVMFAGIRDSAFVCHKLAYAFVEETGQYFEEVRTLIVDACVFYDFFVQRQNLTAEYSHQFFAFGTGADNDGTYRGKEYLALCAAVWALYRDERYHVISLRLAPAYGNYTTQWPKTLRNSRNYLVLC